MSLPDPSAPVERKPFPKRIILRGPILMRWVVNFLRAIGPTLRYWMETEVHVYAFSIAANVLLSFFPFLIVMLALCRTVFHWNAAADAIHFALNDYFPPQVSAFLWRNLDVSAWQLGRIHFFSVFLLFFTANGVFEPLEVALNKAWGVKENRSFLKNQVVSLGLIFLCGGLFLFSVILTAANSAALQAATGVNQFSAIITVIFFKAAAIPMVILILFVVYWSLPNRRIPPRNVLLPAVAVGIVLEAMKYVNAFTWQWFSAKLNREYGPFHYSVAILFWSFFASLVVLAGAEWTARRVGDSGADTVE